MQVLEFCVLLDKTYIRPLDSKMRMTTRTRYFSILKSVRVSTSVILAGKRDSRCHYSTTCICKTVVVVETGYQKVLSFCD